MGLPFDKIEMDWTRDVETRLGPGTRLARVQECVAAFWNHQLIDSGPVEQGRGQSKGESETKRST